MISPPAQPPRDCGLCPRLAAFRQQNQAAFPGFFNGPVPSFGPMDAELLLVGMAPGLKGANRTGRPFTGDYAGDLLYGTLRKYGFAQGDYAKEIDDGLTLHNARLTNAARCVPPKNKLEASEIKACRPFLRNELDALPRLKIVLAIGGDAHKAVLTALGLRASAEKFGHGAVHALQGIDGRSSPLTLIDTYHCSRYNTNTGRLTEEMFHSVFDKIVGRL